MTFLTPSIVLAFDSGGIAGGLRIKDVVRTARVSLTNTLVAGLMLIAAGLVGQLGSIACFIGVVFTLAYAFAMQAWIIRSFELGHSKKDVTYRLERLSSELTLDRDRVRRWTIAQTIAWSFSSGYAAHHYETARWLLSANGHPCGLPAKEGSPATQDRPAMQ